MSGRLWLSAGWAAAWAALALLAALALTAAYTGSEARRRHARLAIAGSLVLFALPMAIRGTSEMAPHLGVLFDGGARYTYAAMVLAWVPLLLLADRGVWSGRLAIVVVVIVAVSTTRVTDRGVGPDWPDAVSSARHTCASGATSAPVRIAPSAAAWTVRLPCARL